MVQEAISDSMEDYLEAIFHIVGSQKVARPKDIGQALGVTGPSVTKALRWLSEHGLVNYAPFELVTLTDAGQEKAKEIVRRHEALRDFFVQVLAVNEERADEVACQMEHSISSDILERLIQYSEFIQVCPRGGSKWMKGFGYRCTKGEAVDDCEKCVEECLEDVRRKKKEEDGGRYMQVSLKDMRSGEKGRIAKVGGRNRANRRIAEMGIGAGAVIEVERVAPLGDPMEVKIKGYHLSLRKEEAAQIMVDPL
ncbi:MAG: DtxR family transcriptional regulator [Candidatus Sumerlaeota bacterium]